MKYVYGRKKWLAAGIAALLISGAGAVPDVLAAPVRATAAEPVRVKVTAMEAGRGPVFLLRRRQ